MEPHNEPSNPLLQLASRHKEIRLQAATELIHKARNDGTEEVEALAQRMVGFLSADWASIGCEKDAVISCLSRIIADPATDLLSVNVIAYALASAGEDGVTELLRLLEHRAFYVNTYTAEAIGALDNRARWAVPALVRFLGRANQPWTRFTIVRALGNIGGAHAISCLQSVARVARHDSHPDEDLLRSVEGALAAALLQ